MLEKGAVCRWEIGFAFLAGMARFYSGKRDWFFLSPGGGSAGKRCGLPAEGGIGFFAGKAVKFSGTGREVGGRLGLFFVRPAVIRFGFAGRAGIAFVFQRRRIVGIGVDDKWRSGWFFVAGRRNWWTQPVILRRWGNVFLLAGSGNLAGGVGWG